MQNKAAKLARRGLNIFYYGKGKGKTTAAMGVVVRAAGAGMDVFVLQFVKAKAPKKGSRLESGEWPLSSEIFFFQAAKKMVKDKKIGKIDTEQVGVGFVGILGDKKEKRIHVAEAKRGLKRAKEIIASDKYDLIVLDELISALELNLLSEKEIISLLKSKPKHTHLIYTGHDPFEKVIEISDLASEINMIKHPYYQGILAQRGIDF